MKTTFTSLDALEQQVLTKSRFFTSCQLWPTQSKMNVNGWLNNFLPHEREHALAILNSFVYYSDALMQAMLKSTFQSLSDHVVNFHDTQTMPNEVWSSFVDDVLFLHVTGEQPNNTDSGFHFLRMARQVLELKESHFPEAIDALMRLKLSNPINIIFVDDFVGSGNQFIETWNRKITLPDSTQACFVDFAYSPCSRFFYCPLVCTQNGYNRILGNCQGVSVLPTHILSEQYSVLSENSLLWPDHLKKTAFDVMKKASLRAGIPDTNGNSVYDWQGFRKIGLAIAFEHSVPDATMPIFYWDKNNWTPLIKRS